MLHFIIFKNYLQIIFLRIKQKKVVIPEINIYAKKLPLILVQLS